MSQNHQTAVNWIFSKDSVSLSHNGTNKIFLAGSPEYEQAKNLLKIYASVTDEVGRDNVTDKLVALLTDKNKVVQDKYAKAGFRVENDIVFVKNEDATETALPTTLGNRLREFATEGLPYQPLLNFWHRLQKNPSNNSLNRLFECLDVNHHPIAPDGRFLAWRKVRRDGNKLVDIYTGKVDNSVGETPRMERNQVDDNHDVTCSQGYHASSYHYARHSYGNSDDVLVEVLVDPADVVSIPNDYNSQKMRICGYEVVREVEDKSEYVDNIYGKYDPNTDEDDAGNEVCEYCGDEDCPCSNRRCQ